MTWPLEIVTSSREEGIVLVSQFKALSQFPVPPVQVITAPERLIVKRIKIVVGKNFNIFIDSYMGKLKNVSSLKYFIIKCLLKALRMNRKSS